MQAPPVFTFARAASTAALLVALSALSGACGDPPETPLDTFVIALGADPQTFDPGEMSGSIEGKVAYQIYEGLVSPPPGDGDPVPGVAERWERSEDGRVWTFYLRDDAKWSNGDPVLASEFAYAWRRMLRGDVPADYISFVRYLRNARGYEWVKSTLTADIFEPVWDMALDMLGVRVIDERTLEVTLEQPTPYFLDIAMFYVMFPVHRASVEELGRQEAFRPENVVSNGPFRVQSYARRNRLELVQNEHYWDRENLGLAGVNLLIIEDNAARVTAFLDNRVDWMNEPPNDQLAFLAGLDSFHGGPQLGTYYYRFNVTDEIVQDRRIRRALALALNRAELCRCTLDDLYTVPRGFVPPLPGYESEDGLVRYDPQEARRLLAEAGYPNGEGLPTLSILYNTNENHRIIAQFVQDQWQLELGIEVELINQEWKVYLETQDNLDYQVSRAGWIGDYMDPDTFLTLWRSTDQNNDTGWENAEYDALMHRQLRETGEQRMETLRQAESLLLSEQVIMPIYYYSQFHLVDTRVRGWEMNLRDVHLARWISKEEGS